MSWLEVDPVSVAFGSDVQALDGAAFTVEDGEFFTIVGPTNAGKSTLLKVIAGLERPTAGAVRLAGRDITFLEPKRRNVSLLFQNIALFPGLSGFDNIAFPLKQLGENSTVIADRVTQVAGILNISHILDRLPRTFSGGEQQRVAIGRAIAAPADLLMLDEPLTNLDARLRIKLRLEFQKMHRETGQSLIYVTHDQTEAMSLSDRIGVLNEGRFEQIGTPDDLYLRPETAFVARFMGSPPMNIVDAKIEETAGGFLARGDGFEVPLDGVSTSGPASDRPQAYFIGVRPESMTVGPETSPETPVAGRILWIERLGSHHVLDVRIGAQTWKVRTRADHPVQVTGPAWFGFTVREGHVLDRATGRFIQ